MKIQENISLARYTTLNIGGPARYFAKAGSESDIEEALSFAEGHGIPIFILGGGSNLLVSDNGFDGLVLQIGLRGIATSEICDGKVLVTSQAGEDWDGFVKFCVEHEFAGVECLSGIPGFVGGTPVQNVGAYGQEVSETIVSVRCFDRINRKVIELNNDECGFSYRRSIFNSIAGGRYIVLGVTFSLTPNGEPRLTYKDLIEYFHSREASLAEIRDAVLAIRRIKSMVIDPADPNSRSAGSFFKNPVIEKGQFPEIQVAYPGIPCFPADHDRVKIPAAWLIEQSGFQKGYSLGNAGISSNHTLALVNRGQATAAEILDLMKIIQDAVDERFGIRLEPEPIFVGF